MKILTLFNLLGLGAPALAQGGAAMRVAGELAESLVRRAAGETAEKTARELAEFGGTRAIREVLEQAEREGGEVLMKQVAAQTEKHGLLALQALKGAKAPVIQALEGVPADLAENSLRALVREPVAMQKLATEFGSSALETAARHPGLAGPIGERLGAEGLDTARRLTLDQAAALSRHADALAKLPAAERSQFMTLIREAPAKTFAWLEKHPKLLIAGSATTAVVLARKEIFGEGPQQGFLERATASLYHTFEKPVNLVLGALCAIVLAWGSFKLWVFSRLMRKRS